MIQPDDIRRKGENLYPEWLRAWLSGDSTFFPRNVPANRDLPDDAAESARLVHRLREGSKEAIGLGYTVQWREVRSRRFGRNSFPASIVFETEDDLLGLIAKRSECADFKRAVGVLRAEFPVLEQWIGNNVKALVESAKELDGLLEVLRYLVAHPRPNCFAREIPIPVDTKFVERNSALLRQWLDIVLPPYTIRSEEEHFELRFGLRYVEPQVLIRFLDEDLQTEAGSPWPVLSLPIHTIGSWSLPPATVLIVENKVNVLTLPFVPRGIVLGGMGNAATLVRHIPWLLASSVLYWGDVDVQGFEILSRVRAQIPHVVSMMMDPATLNSFAACVRANPAASASVGVPPHLTASEAEAYSACAAGKRRLEQEQLPQHAVVEALRETVQMLSRTIR